MNTLAYVTAFAAIAAAPAAALFGTLELAGIGALGATSLSGGGAAFTAGTGTILAAPAGLALGAVGLVGLAVVKGVIVGQALRNSRRRGKRDAEEEEEARMLDGAGKIAALALIDGYFRNIQEQDIDDCGKRLVCEIQTVPVAERTTEESLIATLFNPESTTIDPLSNKVEFDIAAWIGANHDKATCAAKYNRCAYDRHAIGAALRKLERQAEQE